MFYGRCATSNISNSAANLSLYRTALSYRLREVRWALSMLPSRA